MNIYIIGLPMSGKNIIADLLNNKLKYPIININKYIENRSILCNTIHEMYNKVGHNTYLALECSTVKNLINNNKHTIFIIPNTTLYNITIQNLLKETGYIIYVKSDFKDFLSKYINKNEYLLLHENMQTSSNQDDEDIYNIYKYYDNLFKILTKNIIFLSNNNDKNSSTIETILDNL